MHFEFILVDGWEKVLFLFFFLAQYVLLSMFAPAGNLGHLITIENNRPEWFNMPAFKEY
jgi:hypothetical protein